MPHPEEFNLTLRTERDDSPVIATLRRFGLAQWEAQGIRDNLLKTTRIVLE